MLRRSFHEKKNYLGAKLPQIGSTWNSDLHTDRKKADKHLALKLLGLIKSTRAYNLLVLIWEDVLKSSTKMCWDLHTKVKYI
jgi:hypothetical protein